MTPEEIIENAEKMRAGETAMPLDPLERRVFRLETQNTQNTAEIAEVKDRLKNAHHRIDETQRDLQEFRTETRENFKNIYDDRLYKAQVYTLAEAAKIKVIKK